MTLMWYFDLLPTSTQARLHRVDIKDRYGNASHPIKNV